MNAFLDRPSVSAIRRIARIFGTLIAFMALFGMLENISYLASHKRILEHWTGRRIPLNLRGWRRRMV